MTTLVMAAIVIFGVLGYRQLAINDLPQVDFPTIQVSANLPGADPETMSATVATPLERQFATIAGIDNMSSSSSLGATSITIQFSLGRSIDSAAQDVQTAISAALPLLPPMPTRPSFRKVNPADAPILFLSLSSATQPLYVVDEYAENLVAQRISMVDGVAQVTVNGSQKYAVRVQVDPNRLAACGIGLDQVQSALAAGTVKRPTGTLWGDHETFSIQTNDQLMRAKDYRALVVGVRNGRPIRLDQVASVHDSVQNDKVATWLRAGRGIGLAVQRQPNTNTVKVIDDIKAILPSLQASIPESITLKVMYDRSITIRDSVRDVEITLLITVLLVVAVIFLFLRNVTATVIPSLSLPTSLVGTFAVMYLLHFSLNNLSLMALTLCVGFVVDDAIVVLENIVRHMEAGQDAFTASLLGTREVGFTIVSMTVSLVAVFIPILFMSGILGRLFREFAVTITAAVLISGAVALTLIPMLASRFLKHSSGEHGTIYHLLERAFTSTQDAYERLLTLSLRHKTWVLIASIALVFATAAVFRIVPKGFIPTIDSGQIMASTEALQDISFDAMAEKHKQAADILRNEPDIYDFASSAGNGGASNTANAGRIFVILDPLGKRKATADTIIQRLRRDFAQVVGLKIYMQNPPAIRIGGGMSKGLYQVTLQSLDFSKLYAATRQLLDKIKEIDGVQDASTDLQTASLRARVIVDRDKASMLGLTAKQVDSALACAFGNQQVATIYTDTNEYYVILEVKPEFARHRETLEDIHVRSKSGKLVPLAAVTRFSTDVAPLLVSHQGQFPSATISFNIAPGASLGTIVDAIKTMTRKDLPAGVTASFQGNAQAFESSMQNLMLLLVVAILVIYIVLGILYESFAHPITILSGLPSAGIGAMLTLWLFNVDLDIYGFLGLIMLVGIVKKNAIMMVDHALEVERNRGLSAEESIREACLVRFRPIMMTTAAALMGSLPIALGLGSGAEARRPLGLAVVGGLLVSQFLTLFITPVIYIYIDRASAWFGRRRSGTAPQTMSGKPLEAMQ